MSSPYRARVMRSYGDEVEAMTVVACVIPAFNEAEHIARVLGGIPADVQHIVVVDDASTDATGQVVEASSDPRVHLIRHTEGQGVGGAMVSGYRKALELEVDIVVKIDGDGQMDPGEIARLIEPIVRGEADYTKGVRFRDRQVLREMPVVRLAGNLGLSFLAKAASGYWNIFDPTNGFTAIERTALQRLSLSRLSSGFFFETDMLVHLYMIGAVVVDVPTTTHYGTEKSHLRPSKVLLSFPFLLGLGLCKRIVWRYFIRDFSAFSAFFVAGSLLFTFGFVFGAYKWMWALQTQTATPVGTVMVAALPLILGFQLLLQAAVLDIQGVPQRPLQSHRKKSSQLEVLEERGYNGHRN